jgi:hypothetical protein
MAASELHAGMIVIVPNLTPTMQCELFERALSEASKFPDLINKVVEVDFGILCVYELPKLE